MEYRELKKIKLWSALALSLAVAITVFPNKARSVVSNTAVQTVTANGNGVTTNYVIGFDFRDNSQVIVYRVDTSTTPSTSTLIAQGAGSSKFTVSGGNPGTTVVMGTAPTSTQHLIIQRSIPLTQTVSYDEAAAFPASDHEAQMDRMTMLLQQQNYTIGQKVGLSPLSTASPTPIIPDPSADRFVLYNHAGTDFTLGPSSAYTPATNDLMQFTGSEWKNVQPSSLTAGNVSGTVAVANGGTGQTSANAALNALLPSQSGKSGDVLKTDGSNTSWVSAGLGTVSSVDMTVPSFLSISGNPVTSSGTLALSLSGSALPVANGGTGATSFTSNRPLIGSGSSAVGVGSVSGNTTTFATASGTLTSGDCVQFDASGNLVDAGASCGSGSFTSPMTTLGDLLYENSTPTAARLAGNTTSTKKYLSQTGTGAVSAAPSWSQPAFSELSGNLANGQLPTAETWPSSGTVQATTPNNHGVLISGSGATATVITPNASTALPLVSGGASADPTWAALTIAGGGTSLTAAGTDGQVLKSMNSAFINSSYPTPYVNYIGNSLAETNTNGWATYSGTAENIPVSGTGGTATGLTFSRSTSSPLRGGAMFSLVQDAANRQGKGVSYDFAIDPADQAKVLAVRFDFNAPSGMVVSDGITAPLNDGTTTTNAGNSDLEVFIYDKTNSVLIPVSPQVLTAKGSNKYTYKGAFQTASNSTLYRLIFHIATANTTGWTFTWANAYVGPQILVSGAPVTDYATNLSITANGFGTVTSPQYQWRREGDSMHLKGSFVAGTTAASTASFSLPSGYTIDTTKSSTTSGVGNLAGTFVRLRAGAGPTSFEGINDSGVLFFDGSTTDRVFLAYQEGSNVFHKDNANNFASSGDPIVFDFVVTISGWSSTVQMSNDTDTRTVTLQANKANGSVTANTTIPTWTNVNKDSHGAFNSSTGVYTVPVAGDYQVDFMANTTSGTVDPQIRKNGTIIWYGAGATGFGQVHGLVTGCVPGDTITVTLDGSLTISSTATETALSISRVSGPTTIAATDTVAAHYHASATSISSSLATISWTTSDYDSHGAMSAGTYTLPISGKYHVHSCVILGAASSAAGNAVDMQLQKNGSAWSEVAPVYQSTQTALPVCIDDDVNGLAGDTIRIQLSSAATTPAITASSSKNFFSIHRVGN